MLQILENSFEIQKKCFRLRRKFLQVREGEDEDSAENRSLTQKDIQVDGVDDDDE